MKKTFIIVASLLLNLVFMQNRNCSEIINPEECYNMGCEWIVSYEEIGNELILTEECFDPNNDNDDWDDNDNYCEGLTEDECFEAEGCQWYDGEGCYRFDEDGPPECLLDCEGIEYIYPEENPYETCDWIISNFGPNNFMNPCAEDCDNETMMHINEYVEVCFQCLADNNCDDIFNEEEDEIDSCSDIDNLEECENAESCEWIENSNNMPPSYGSCVENEWDNNDCDPDLACATVLTCYEDLLYPTSCGPQNCDEPIGECENNIDDGCFEDGEWYCYGCELFINDCEYIECTPNGWSEPYTLDNDECSNEEWECSDLGYEDCMEVDYCEWSSYMTPNGFFEGCINADGSGGGNDWGCFEDGEWYCYGCELFINDCEYIECTPNGWSEPYTLDNDECSNEEWECSDLGYEDCMQVDYCEWFITDNFDAGSCVDIEENDDGPPECMIDCEGIEDVNPEEDGTYFCNWLLDIFPTGCAEDCEQDILDDIEEFMILCDECLPTDNCDEMFDDNHQSCEDLNYTDCIENEECEWIIVTPAGGYGCVEYFDDNNCLQLGFEDCLENPNCQPDYNAAGEYEGCGYYNDEFNFGILFGRVEYIYGDVIDFVPFTTLHIESLPSNSDIFYFETMTDGEGYYQIDLPVGAYIVTAYANNESLTQDIQITANNEHELNFLLGDWGGPWYSFAELSLGSASGSPGSDVVMPLYLSSSEYVGGVQFTIQPGIENAITTVQIDSIDPCFEANYNTLDNGQIIGIIFSIEGCSYPPEEMLHIADLVFNINNSFENGNIIELFFNNTIISDTNGNEIPSYGAGNIITVGLLGDVNGDNEINVLDVVIAINFALYVNEPSDSEFWASDINSDGMINVLDIVQLVNIILEN